MQARNQRPAGALIGGASATTISGLATFPAVTFDMPGIYRLIATSLDASELRNRDLPVLPSDVLFANGFD